MLPSHLLYSHPYPLISYIHILTLTITLTITLTTHPQTLTTHPHYSPSHSQHTSLGMLLQPQLNKKRSVTNLKSKHVKTASKYVLTHQGVDSDGDVVTQLIKVNKLL